MPYQEEEATYNNNFTWNNKTVLEAFLSLTFTFFFPLPFIDFYL